MTNLKNPVAYDTEFLERGPDYPISLISIGMVREALNPLNEAGVDELHLVNRDADWLAISRNQWLMLNVWPHLPGVAEAKFEPRIAGPVTGGRHGWEQIEAMLAGEHPAWVSRGEMRDQIKLFCGDYPALWAYYSDYDHVLLSQLFGTMIQLPDGWPKFTLDINQEMRMAGITKAQLPRRGVSVLHSALDDALWVWDAITQLGLRG